MKIKELQQKLQEAYTPANLNHIALTLINLYKNQQYSILRKIADKIGDIVNIEIADNGKGFSKFLMLYHPDRAALHINEINRLAATDNLEGLIKLSHILLLNDIEEFADSLDSYEDIDYSPVYEWDLNTDGFSIIRDDKEPEKFKTSPNAINFYDAIKYRAFGDTDTEFPSYYLEDLDEFELSSSDINDLEGAAYCIHAITMDLSDNMISDLSPLFGLSLLEELNLSDNQIGDIEVLSNLKNLKSLNLANNAIEDISPLFDLTNLEYVDLSGNNMSEEQIIELTETGVTVDI